MNLLTVYFQELFNRTKPQFLLVTKWLCIGGIIGGLAFLIKPDLLETVLKIFEDKFGAEPALDFNLVREIFLNNLQAAGIALFGGLLVGIGPFVVVATNGFILGFILISILSASKANLINYFVVVATGLLPHGVIEIPAFLLAAALGLKLGLEWLKKESFGHRSQVFKDNLKLVFLKGIPAIIILLFIAALIEVYVSGHLVDFLN